MSYTKITQTFVLFHLVILSQMNNISCRDVVNYVSFASLKLRNSLPWKLGYQIGSHNRRSTAKDDFIYSSWTNWSECDYNCRQKRERYCWKRQYCGTLRLVEEQLCSSDICQPLQLISFGGDGAAAAHNLKYEDSKETPIHILKETTHIQQPTTISSKYYYEKPQLTPPPVPKKPPRKVHKALRTPKLKKSKTKIKEKLEKIPEINFNHNDHIAIFHNSIWDYPRSNYDFKKSQLVTNRLQDEHHEDRYRPVRSKKSYRPRRPRVIINDDLDFVDNSPAFSEQNEEILINISNLDGMKNVKVPHLPMMDDYTGA